MLLILLIVQALHAFTTGAPIIPDVAAPEGSATLCQHFRTVSSIVWSCALTMFACAWMVVRPNLPGPNDTKMQIFGKRMKLVCITLLVPEYTLFWALHQRATARELVKAAQEGTTTALNLGAVTD
jgi:hypothetical protein